MGYLAKLKSETYQSTNTTTGQVAPHKPLTDQITELMSSLPPALRDRPWNMSELVQRLSGKYRTRPHPQQVGDALRKLGWVRKRVYGDYGGLRIWLNQ